MDSSLTTEEINTLLKELDSPCDMDTKTRDLRELILCVNQENRDHAHKDYYNHDHFVIRKLIDLWVTWIALDGLDDDRQDLIDMIARELRTVPDAVHSLVDHFAFDLKLTTRLKTKIINDAIESDVYPFLNHYLSDNQGSHNFSEINPNPSLSLAHVPDKKRDPEIARNLLASLLSQYVKAERSPEYEELGNQLEKTNIKTFLNKLLDLLFEEERLRRQKLVVQRVTSLLAHMSDKRFYGNDQTQYDRVHKLLKEHAVPVIMFNLPKHTDLETRWHVGLMLGYVGGRWAIDGLVTVLIDEKTTREARQKVLSKYYLEPSNRQSQQAIRILDQAVEDARSTMRTQRILNICIFGVGILLLLTSIYLAAFPDNKTGGSWQQFSGFFTFLGGIGAIMYNFFSHPLRRIQNAMASLAQIETAFTNFIWVLNLNGAYIQSRYVADGKLTDYEISRTTHRLEQSMTATMKQLAKYTVIVEKMQIPQIDELKPTTANPGASVEIPGQHL